MKKALFIDRDGTLIVEPQDTFQIDSLERLTYIPGVFKGLGLISEMLDYELVMISNQDGLGTDLYPQSAFDMVQEKLMETLHGEGIYFSEVLIDSSFEHEALPTRKPGTGLLTKYFDGSYDLKNSFVIGDRLTDLQLAKNIGCKGIFIGTELSREQISNANLEDYCQLITMSWIDIFYFLRKSERTASVVRKTNETEIDVGLSLDGSGIASINTGLGFFNHMLEQLCKHSGIDLSVKVIGDLHIDEHHTIEDTALALGTAIRQALGDKIGIERYGFDERKFSTDVLLPMDEALTRVALDFSGRPWLVWDADFQREKIGDMPTEMFMHFFKSFSDAALCNLNIKVEGQNEHHKIESIFKGLAKAIKMAASRQHLVRTLPSTKGLL
jgi:imidazoleglycerol-phosphate dehydratase/histidinol-phosphatase